MTTTLLETCRILPPPTDEVSIPLSFFDMKWLHFHPLRRLLFYDHPCSKPQFLDAIVPHLKQSLSLTLKHYLPVAGNLLYPSSNTDQKPRLRCVAGDSVPLTIAESTTDFDMLTGNHARDADQFYDFVAPMPPIAEEFECKIVPVFSLQVTLFPGRGICIGLSNHHCLGDARSVVGFVLAWASINKFGGDEEFLSENGESLPIFDRSLIKDPLEIDTIFWKVLRNIPLKPSSFPLPTNRVRATFVLSQSDIKRLKHLANNNLVQPSSFVVAAAYIWSCMVKSGDGGEANAPELFVIPADARGRTNPPVPANYFGNCIVGGVVKVEHEKMAGNEGFVIAAEAIAGEIKNKMNDKEEILKGAENWLSEIWKCMGMSVLGISGSPKFDLSNADFGWGKARKLEVVSIDGEKYTMSLCNSDCGLEVGLSLPGERMEAFAAIFADGLAKLDSS
ncbi:hypothetical protein C2S51_003943 [Perilla frutescens var. frutescens]|uniref:Malonyl CoA:anthocyanin 5-O-glucoside-6'''-O-malonyltransferase n=1 Tax=Perilla frutescens TaxID=48386 RepID=Q8W1X0_PERFR|nr:malonyl CoA:anthocyanin 5-O-glucoside-6'''-O-malonyltransferase [Perilla frutescens]KAH6788937.1 hypothetical protein C2S51_003943 [Perilla frutescens var. frutescens]